MSYADRRAPSESGRGRRGALGRSDDSLWPAFGCRGVADPRRPAQLPPGAGLVDGTARSGDDRVGHPDAAASAAGVDGTRRGGGTGLAGGDRKSVVWGTSVSVRVDLGGHRIIKKNTTTTT